MLRALVCLRIELLLDEWCDASEPFSLGLHRAAQQLDVVLDATEVDSDERRLAVLGAWCDDMLRTHQPSTQVASGCRTVVTNVRSALDVWI